MLPANLSPVEIFDLGILNEATTFTLYDRLARRVRIDGLISKLALLKKDEKDHRKTLRAHRRSLFGQAPSAVTEEDAERIFGVVNISRVGDKESLIKALDDAIRAEEYGAYFYERMRDRIPDREARIFFEVLASEGRFHAAILKQQVALVRVTADSHFRKAS